MNLQRYIAELKRRKVVQAVGVYIVAAWIVLEVATVVGDIWAAPNWVIQVVFVLLLLGLPVAAVASWIFDVTGRGIVRTGGETGGRTPEPTVRWRLVRGVVSGFAGIAAVVVAVGLVGFAWPDEYPSEDVRRLGELQNERTIDPDAFGFAMYGFNAPPGHDSWDYGRFIVRTFNLTGEWVYDHESALLFVDRRFCFLATEGCVDTLPTHVESVERRLQANAELMERYSLVRASRNFNPVIRGDLSPRYGGLNDLIFATWIRGLDALRRLETGDAEGAWRILDEEHRFHRRFLADSSSLVQKRFAITLVDMDIRIQAYAWVRARAYGLPIGSGPPPRMTRAELSVAAPFRDDASYILRVLDANREEFATTYSRGSIARYLAIRFLPLKRNRTANRFIGPMMDIARAAIGPASEVASIGGEGSVERDSWFEWVINGGGIARVADHYMAGNYHRYVMGVHRLDATIVLARAAHELMLRDADPMSVHGHLVAVEDRFRNPFDGQVPVWRDGVLMYPEQIPGLAPNAQPRLDLPLQDG